MSDNKNVIVLVLDSLRKDRLSIHNDEVDFTQNFEEIAGGSKVFRNAVANAPWTLPSTASMFTGEYPWEHGATHEKTSLNTDKKVLAERFQEEGYRTKVITPNTWISPSIGTVDGFDEVENFLGLAGRGPVQTVFEKSTEIFNWLDEGTRKKVAYIANVVFEKFTTVDLCKSRETTDETKKFLENVEDEDFFLFVNLMSAHEPYDPGDPPQEYLDRHGVEDISQVPSTEREFFNDGYDQDELEKAYDASVDYTDDLVGEIHDTLRNEGLDEDTVFVLLGDHGQAVGKDEVYGHQFTVMDRVVDVPMMVYGEDTGSKEDIFELRQLYDLVPHLAGFNEEPGEIEEVKGSYEFPEFFVGVIPEEKRDKYDRKFRFVKTEDRNIVKSITRSGEESYSMYDSDGEEIEVEEDMKRKVDGIGDVSESEDQDIDDEEVKQRLEDLGYM